MHRAGPQRDWRHCDGLRFGHQYDFITIKNDRSRNAKDYIQNDYYDKSLRNIVRDTLLEGEAPIGIDEITTLFQNTFTPIAWISYLRMSDLVLKVNLFYLSVKYESLRLIHEII